MNDPSPHDPIAIIIVTHNSTPYLRPLFKSLLSEIQKYSCTVCCIDNQSIDQTVEELTRVQSEIGLPHLLQSLTKNIGLPAANNAGVACVEKNKKHSTFIFLNPDTEVLPGWLSGLIEELRDPEVGSVQSLALLPDRRINTQGGGLHYLGFGYTTNLYQNIPFPLPPPSEIGYSSGVSLAISRKTLKVMEQVDGAHQVFWELLFLYGEDSELGWRLSLLGFKNRSAPKSQLLHHYDFLNKRSHSRQFYWIERNRWLTLFALYRLPTILLLLPLLLLVEIGLSWRYHSLMNFSRVKLHLEVFKIVCTPAFQNHRKWIQAARIKSDRKILQQRDSILTHPGIENWSRNSQKRSPFTWIDPIAQSALHIAYQFYQWIIRW